MVLSQEVPHNLGSSDNLSQGHSHHLGHCPTVLHGPQMVVFVEPYPESPISPPHSISCTPAPRPTTINNHHLESGWRIICTEVNLYIKSSVSCWTQVKSLTACGCFSTQCVLVSMGDAIKDPQVTAPATVMWAGEEWNVTMVRASLSGLRICSEPHFSATIFSSPLKIQMACLFLLLAIR